MLHSHPTSLLDLTSLGLASWTFAAFPAYGGLLSFLLSALITVLICVPIEYVLGEHLKGRAGISWVVAEHMSQWWGLEKGNGWHWKRPIDGKWGRKEDDSNSYHWTMAHSLPGPVLYALYAFIHLIFPMSLLDTGENLRAVCSEEAIFPSQVLPIPLPGSPACDSRCHPLWKQGLHLVHHNTFSSGHNSKLNKHVLKEKKISHSRSLC